MAASSAPGAHPKGRERPGRSHFRPALTLPMRTSKSLTSDDACRVPYIESNPEIPAAGTRGMGGSEPVWSGSVELD